MEKINVIEILNKHKTQKGDADEETMAAIKEIVEAVVDECEQQSSIEMKDSRNSKKEPIDIGKWLDMGADGFFRTKSILQVKQLIDYE